MSLDITSYDPNELKQSLIEFYQNRPGFQDFNYEGSAINTIIDNLVRNTHYIAYMANMVASESFLDSAQLRSNIVSHAQKLSYTPKSKTAASIVVNLKVVPTSPPSEFSIVCDKNSAFINTIDGIAYSFVNTEDVTLVRQGNDFVASNVTLKQGLMNTQKFLYNGKKVEIQNTNIDTSTLRVNVRASQTSTVTTEYIKSENITDSSDSDFLFYLSENTRGFYDIEFGKGVLGVEPAVGSVIEVEYIVVEEDHANGLSAIVAASPIDDYSDIVVDVVTPAFGGADRASIEMIKFMAPRIHEAQERAVKEDDYEVLARRDFPFVKSVIAWGGERNDPPYYGRVFLSAIPQEGYVIADSVKSVITENMKKYSLLTTQMVDPEYIFTDLDIKVMYDAAKTTKTFDQIKTAISQVVDDYSNSIKEFDRWYNNTALEQAIVNKVQPIYSVEISKNVYKRLNSAMGGLSTYSAKFVNRIVPSTVKIYNVFVDASATSQLIEDDGLGNLFLVVAANKFNVGKVNYVTGNIEFQITQLNNNQLSINVQLESENIQTSRNFVVAINNVTVSKVERNG